MDGIAPAVEPPTETAVQTSLRADEFSSVLSRYDVASLQPHHAAITLAVIELTADAGTLLRWSQDDPTVSLLRAAARLSLIAPTATSAAAAELAAQLASS